MSPGLFIPMGRVSGQEQVIEIDGTYSSTDGYLPQERMPPRSTSFSFEQATGQLLLFLYRFSLFQFPFFALPARFNVVKTKPMECHEHAESSQHLLHFSLE